MKNSINVIFLQRAYCIPSDYLYLSATEAGAIKQWANDNPKALDYDEIKAHTGLQLAKHHESIVIEFLRHCFIAADADGCIHAFTSMPEFDDTRGVWLASDSVEAFDCRANYISLSKDWKFSVVALSPCDVGRIDEMLCNLDALRKLHEAKMIDDATIIKASADTINSCRFPYDMMPEDIDYIIIKHSPYKFTDIQVRALKKKVQDFLDYGGTI